MSYFAYPTITLAQAKNLTGLDLVSAREVRSDLGLTYHNMEEESESKSHASARMEGINYFCSIGYQVFPEGVGIKGTYTLADFLAVRANRTVFVEVLSDTNITEEALQRKSQLQNHGELCFIVFSGTKRSDEEGLLAAKRAIEQWADVLYCRIDGYSGIRIRHTSSSTIAYDTTRERGIRIALSFDKSGRKLEVRAKFLTHLYRNPCNTPISYCVLPISYCYEEIFLTLFEQFSRSTEWRIKRRSRKKDVAIRTIRRKSGLSLVGNDGRVAARIRSEYRGDPVEKPYMWTFHPSSMDLPLDEFYGVFTLEKTGPEGLRLLLRIVKEYGLTVECDSDLIEDALAFLKKQTVVDGFPQTVRPEGM